MTQVHNLHHIGPRFQQPKRRLNSPLNNGILLSFNASRGNEKPHSKLMQREKVFTPREVRRVTSPMGIKTKPSNKNVAITCKGKVNPT